MSRNQRRLGRVLPKRNDSDGKVKPYTTKDGTKLKELLPPKTRRNLCKIDKPTTNRCCYFNPDYKDFGQLTETDQNNDKYQHLLLEQYGFNPDKKYSVEQWRQLRKILCNSSAKVENSSQCETQEEKVMVPAHVETIDGSQWQNIDNSDEKDKYIGYNIEKVESRQSLQSIHISETPRVKIIAEKFSKIKKNNVELRKLDEKVVCVEYDVYVGDNMSKSQQTMRAFFSIKPACKEGEKGKTFKESVTSSVVPSKIKQTFATGDEELKMSKEKEIEMIDGKISENRSYLDDLKKILKHNHAVLAKKNKNTLDLMSLYEMAKKEVAPLNSNSNLLSKAELEEIKDLILNKCASSVHGISRRRVKRELDSEFGKERGVLSQSLVAELMREGNV